jgi:hypothetical protein
MQTWPIFIKCLCLKKQRFFIHINRAVDSIERESKLSYITPWVLRYCWRQTKKLRMHMATANHIPIMLIRSMTRSAYGESCIILLGCLNTKRRIRSKRQGEVQFTKTRRFCFCYLFRGISCFVLKTLRGNKKKKKSKRKESQKKVRNKYCGVLLSTKSLIN